MMINASTHMALEPHASSAKWLLWVSIAICVMFVMLVSILPKDNRVAVLVAPWSEPHALMNVIGSANGQIVNGGKADWIMVADSNSETFIEDLYSAGAMLVIDGKLAAACL